VPTKRIKVYALDLQSVCVAYGLRYITHAMWRNGIGSRPAGYLYWKWAKDVIYFN